MDNEQHTPPETDSSKEDLREAFEILKAQIPQQSEVQVQIPKSNSGNVSDHNHDIIKVYLDIQNEHLKQQKTVGLITALAVVAQLVAFNILIFLVVLLNFDFQTKSLLLEFMKYYIGAVIVEMLGLCYFIVRCVYTTNIEKIAEHIVKQKNK